MTTPTATPGSTPSAASAPAAPGIGSPRATRAQRRAAKNTEQGLAPRGGPVWTLIAWVLTLIIFTPVAWMVLTSLHGDTDAETNPPSVFAALTLDKWHDLGTRITPYLINSAMSSVFSTLLILLLAVPAAYALSIKPVEKWTDVMFFFLSTKFLPGIAALLPIYLIVKQIDMLDNIWTLVVLYTSMNLPIAVWMMRSFLAEVPREILEAAEVDGAGLLRVLWNIVRPIALPGIAATALICVIFSWNEFMFAVNLTATRSATAPLYVVGFITSEGAFLAQLCAAATAVSLPVLIAGFIAQDKLVRGLSLGAVK